MNISTVNIVSEHDGTLFIKSFPDTPEGNKEAERTFRTILIKHGVLTKEEINDYIEDGYYENNSIKLSLIHSI